MAFASARSETAIARQLMSYADQIRRLAVIGFDGADDAEAIAAALERQAERLSGPEQELRRNQPSELAA